ncbi:Peroxisomal coenzyme A diphosphatase NUDT7 [Liparis tanakae]|uniref:Peroxisomal coenzyme A diphosphatase NUDT7 n=1 Tax=Liparis tanakae TaxID=230148 RepID=A0A4Z2HZ12_9TELE|nr:Peroxisomal coenzyme A diphosphatase NUDT7 [Liparis tanakae]
MHIKEETIAILKQFDIGNKFASLSTLRKASVLIPLMVKNGELCALMTLRSQEVSRVCALARLLERNYGGVTCVSVQLRTSPGEVCFPGGKRDPSDEDDVDTALREAEEEIGLPPADVQSGLLVTPVVGFIDEAFRPRPNPAEVSAVFTVPLDLFASDKDHDAAGMIPSFDFVDPDSGTHFHIWGLTAMFAILVAVLALRRTPEFHVFNSEEPFSFLQQILHQRTSKL